MLYLFNCKKYHFWYSASEEPQRCDTCGEMCKYPALMDNDEDTAEFLNSLTPSAKNKAPRRVL
jgi:hypothetical protein